MADILESWKKHTANRANRLLRRHGKFWQADYWDTYMRDGAHELETRNYIEHNLLPQVWSLTQKRGNGAVPGSATCLGIETLAERTRGRRTGSD